MYDQFSALLNTTRYRLDTIFSDSPEAATALAVYRPVRFMPIRCRHTSCGQNIASARGFSARSARSALRYPQELILHTITVRATRLQIFLTGHRHHTFSCHYRVCTAMPTLVRPIAVEIQSVRASVRLSRFGIVSTACLEQFT